MALDPFGPNAGLDLSQPVAGLDPFAPDPNAPGPFRRGLRTGIAGVKAAARGVQALGARAIGAEVAEAEALQAAQDTLQATAPDQMRVEDVSSPGEAFDFAKYALGTALPSILTMVGGGILGRGVAGLVAKRYAAQATREMVKQAGLVGGAAASSIGIEAGSIFPEAVESKVEDPALRAVAGGVAAGALDILPGYAAARRLGLVGDAALRAPRKAGAGAVLKGAGRDALTGLALESTTEATQAVIERAAAGQPLDTPEAISDYLNSAAIGAVAGGTIGGAVGGVRTLQQPVQEPAPAITGVQPPIVSAPPAEVPLPVLTSTEGALPDIRDLGVPPVVDTLPVAPDAGAPRVPTEPDYRRGAAPVAADADYAALEALRAQQETAAAHRIELDAEFKLPEGKRRVKSAIANESRALNTQIGALNTQIGVLTQQIRNRFASEESAEVIARAPERTLPTEPVFTESGAFKRTPIEDTTAAELTVARQKQSVGALVSSREAKLLRNAAKAAPVKPAVAVVEERQARERFKQVSPERRAEVIEGVATQSIETHRQGLAFRQGTEPAAIEGLKRAAVAAAQVPTIEAAEKAVYDAAIRALAGKVNKQDAETFAQAVAADVRSAPTLYSKAGASAQLAALAVDVRAPVLVNIGLATNDGKGVTVEEVLAALQPLGVEESTVRQSATEQTLVARLARAPSPEEAEAISVALRQEAIAVMTGVEGELYGPGAAQWRPFNPEFFLNLDGSRATASNAAVMTAIDQRDNLLTEHGQALIAHLKGMIGEDPQLEVRLYQAGPGEAIGGYTRTNTLKSVISLALNAKGDLSVADHEGFHYLEDKVLDGR